MYKKRDIETCEILHFILPWHTKITFPLQLTILECVIQAYYVKSVILILFKKISKNVVVFFLSVHNSVFKKIMYSFVCKKNKKQGQLNNI